MTGDTSDSDMGIWQYVEKEVPLPIIESCSELLDGLAKVLTFCDSATEFLDPPAPDSGEPSYEINASDKALQEKFAQVRALTLEIVKEILPAVDAEVAYEQEAEGWNQG